MGNTDLDCVGVGMVLGFWVGGGVGKSICGGLAAGF